MCFRSKLIFTIGFLFLSACTPKIGEVPPPATVGQFGETACLSGTSEIVKDFFEGVAQPHQVSAGWSCVEDAFNKFNKFVRGRDQNRYYVHELAEFFEKYFIEKDSSGNPRNTISPKFQTELMKIKQLFIGGSREYVTRSELAYTIRLLGTLRNISLRLNPYMKIYTMKWKMSGDEVMDGEYFEAANLELQNFSKEISSLMIANHEPYSFDDFFMLLDQMSGFYNEKWTFIETIRNYLPLVKKIKKTVAGGAEDRIYPDEWKNFLFLGARAYVLYGRYTYFLSQPPVGGTSIRLRYVARAAEDIMSAFEQLVREKPESQSRRSGHRSKSEGQIKRGELIELLTALNQVWPSFVFSELLVDEAMLVKQVFFGGQKDSWTSNDFANARLKVPPLKDILEKVTTYYPVYINEWKPARYTEESAQIYFKEAQNNLSIALSDFGKLFEGSYKLDHLVRLLDEINRLYPGAIQTSADSNGFSKYKALIQHAKNMLFEDSDDEIKIRQWPTFLNFVGRFYSHYLHYGYFIKEQSFKNSSTLFSLRYLADSSFETVDSLLKTKPSGYINQNEIKDLVLRIQELGALPKELTDGAIESVTKAGLNSVLNPPERRLRGEKPSRLDALALASAKYEVSSWLETEMFFRQIFGRPQDNLTFTAFELQQKIDEKLLELSTLSELQTGLLESKRVLSSQVPLIVDDEGRLRIFSRIEPNYTADSLSRLNLTRTASRVLMRAYAGEESRITNYAGVTKDEAQFAFDELKQPFVDLNFLSPENKTFINNRFMEANIFVPRSDGDNLASFLELNDIMNTIFSGVILDNQLKPDLLKKCLNGLEEAPSSALLNYQCVYEVYQSSIPTKLTSVPDYLSYFVSNDSCNNQVAFFNLIKAAGYIPNEKQEVMLGDVALFPHVVQYLELVFSRFDSDKSGSINQVDAQLAFPVFQGLFRDMAKEYIDKGLLKEEDLWPLFTYVLKNGKIPETAGDFLKFMIWKGMPEKRRTFNTDRNKLAAILGVVADKATAAPAAAGRPFKRFFNSLDSSEPKAPEADACQRPGKAPIDPGSQPVEYNNNRNLRIYLNHLEPSCRKMVCDELDKK